MMKEDKKTKQKQEPYSKPASDYQLKTQDEFLEIHNNRKDDEQPLRQQEDVTRDRNRESDEREKGSR